MTLVIVINGICSKLSGREGEKGLVIGPRRRAEKKCRKDATQMRWKERTVDSRDEISISPFFAEEFRGIRVEGSAVAVFLSRDKVAFVEGGVREDEETDAVEEVEFEVTIVVEAERRGRERSEAVHGVEVEGTVVEVAVRASKCASSMSFVVKVFAFVRVSRGIAEFTKSGSFISGPVAFETVARSDKLETPESGPNAGYELPSINVTSSHSQHSFAMPLSFVEFAFVYIAV